ncbi:MAG: GvpL/GvpF family gas vesicle protein [Gaiellaceae bacterium]
MSDPLYVYGVVPRDEHPALSAKGVGGSPVEMVEHGDLAALASHVGGDTLRAPRELRAHWSVLQEVCEATTVVPVRFGTVLEDEQAVRERLLAANAEHLDELLAQLRGCVQVVVKGSYIEPELLHEIVTSSAGLSVLSARVRSVPPAAAYYDRIRLGERIAEAIAERRTADTQLVLDALGPLAVAARTEDAPGALDSFNVSLLVKRTAQREVGRKVEELAQDLGEAVEVRYVGPLPPYSFAEAQLGSGDAQWA